MAEDKIPMNEKDQIEYYKGYGYLWFGKGEIYRLLHQYNYSLTCYENNILYCERSYDSWGQYECYIAIAKIYLCQYQYQTAFDSFEDGLVLLENNKQEKDTIKQVVSQIKSELKCRNELIDDIKKESIIFE